MTGDRFALVGVALIVATFAVFALLIMEGVL